MANYLTGCLFLYGLGAEKGFHVFFFFLIVGKKKQTKEEYYFVTRGNNMKFKFRARKYFFLENSHVCIIRPSIHHVCIVCGGFCATTAELGSCDNDLVLQIA